MPTACSAPVLLLLILLLLILLLLILLLLILLLRKNNTCYSANIIPLLYAEILNSYLKNSKQKRRRVIQMKTINI
jgi:hypothetical protein